MITRKIKIQEYADYYSVFDKTGKKICDASCIDDALMMVSFQKGRTYKKVKVLTDQVVNVQFERMDDDKQLKSQNILPERQQIPLDLQ